MRKTKIICTMGPSTDKGDVMEQLVREGMDVARFNFSHGPHDEQRGRIQKLRELRKKYDLGRYPIFLAPMEDVFLIQRDRRSDLDASRMARFLWKKDRFLHLQIKILKELMSA